MKLFRLAVLTGFLVLSTTVLGCLSCHASIPCNDTVIANIKETKAWPCLNGGSPLAECRDGGGTRFLCNCPTGYLPHDCSIKDPCADNPCKNGGTCVRNVNLGYCPSPSPRDRCGSPMNCDHLVNDTGYRCDCLPGYYGTHCEEKNCEPRKADVIFLLDSSFSMSAEMFEKQKEFVKSFIDEVIIGPDNFLISVITFSTDAQIRFHLDDHQTNASLKNALMQIPYTSGATLTEKALALVDDVVAKSSRTSGNVTRFLILITDGMSTNRQETRKQALAIKSARTVHKVLAIGVGQQVSHTELKDIASDPDYFTPSYVFSAQNFNALFAITHQLVHICEHYAKSKFSEIVLLLDIGPFSDFQTQSRASIIHFIHDLELDNYINGTRVQVVTFNDHASVLSDVTETNRSEVLARIAMPFNANRTKSNVINALHFVEDEILSKLPTNRISARKFIIIFSNGNFSDMSSAELNETKHRFDAMDCVLSAVGTGHDVLFEMLQTIVSDPYNVFIILNNQFDAMKIFQSFFTYNTYTDGDVVDITYK